MPSESVQSLELGSGVVRDEAPVYGCSLPSAFTLPGVNFLGLSPYVADVAVRALTREHRELDLGLKETDDTLGPSSSVLTAGLGRAILEDDQ